MQQFELKDKEGKVYLKARIEEHNPWIYGQWIGHIDVVQLQQGLEELIQLFHKTQCPYVVSDRRLAQGNWFEINNWVENIWIPRAVREGLQYMAHVVAPEYQSKVSAKDLEGRLLGIKFKVFETLDEAETWMRSIVEANQK